MQVAIVLTFILRHIMGIQRKIILAILIAGFMALIIGLSVTYYEVKGVLTEAIGNNFAEIAKKTSDRFDAAIKKEIITFRYLADDPSLISAIRNNDRDNIEAYLIRYLKLPEELEVHLGLFVVNERGLIIAGSRRYKEDQSKEERWRVTYNRGEGKVYASDIYTDSLTGKRAMDLGIPVSDPSTGTVAGAIMTIVNVDEFFKFIAESNFAQTGHGMIINSGGRSLICPVLPPDKHAVNQSLIEMVTGKGGGWSLVGEDLHGGKNSVVGFSQLRYLNSLGDDSLGGYKWYTYIRQDPGETFAPVKRLMLMLFIVESLLVLLICALGVWLVRRLVLNPVDSIHGGVEQIEQGHLDYRIDIKTGDELESLADGFNKMAASLKDLYHNLETMIRERTSELETTKNYLESILRNSSDMIITTNLDGRIVTFNEGAEQMLGYKQDEVIGTLISDYYYNKADRQKLLEMVNAGKMVTNYEAQIIRKDGKVIDISLSLSELRNENGDVIGTVGISKDITDWKLAQHKLKEYSLELQTMVEQRTMELLESKAHLEAMLGGIAEGVVFVDSNNKITLINDAAEKIFGIRRDDWYGKDFKYAHSEKAHAKAIEIIADMKKGKIKSYSSEIKADEKTVFAHFSPIVHGSEYLGVIFMATDITEMKRLEAELHTSEERYRDLVENSPEMIHSVNKDRFFIGVNKTELRILGYSLEEMLNMRLEDIVTEDHREKITKHVERVITEGSSTTGAQFITKDGRIIDVEINASALYDPVTNQFVKTRAFVRDVTELKRLQADLVQSEKLALVGKMSSAVAHELRNPLVPIGGFANLIYKRLNEESPLKKYAGIIVREIDRLEKLLHNILYFTKDTKPEFKPGNLNEIINEMLFFYKSTFEENNISLDIRLSPDLPLVSLDHSLIKQALINIIINAIQSMESGGLLSVESMIRKEDDAVYAVVVVNDTGAGIPEDLMKNIFDPFYTTKIHGLGLGLSLTRRIVESHGGEITVDSAEGIGSTFTIRLPAS